MKAIKFSHIIIKCTCWPIAYPNQPHVPPCLMTTHNKLTCSKKTPANFPRPIFPPRSWFTPSFSIFLLQSVWRTGLISMPHIHLHTFAHRSLWMNGGVVFSLFRSPKVGEERVEGGEVLAVEVEGGSSFQGTPPELMFHTCAQCGSLYQPSQVRHINCGRDHFAFHRGVPFGSQHVLPNLS